MHVIRTINASRIAEQVKKLVIQTNTVLSPDVLKVLNSSFNKEKSARGKTILSEILQNAKISKATGNALCQDTGIAEVFVKIGQDVKIYGGTLYDAINKGVAQGYAEGYLRKSVVADPLNRKNTKTNTPAFITADIVKGNSLEITFMPKGGGTENASVVNMFNPSSSWDDIRDFVVETVRQKGIKACPPLVVGVGIGGSFSTVAMVSKKALLRDLGDNNADKVTAKQEKELLEKINKTGIGPMGLGGKVTALAVHIEKRPCHIASLPVAVSIHCHSLRRKTVRL